MSIKNGAETKVLTLLSCVQMCKFFSHFGVRTLLILYLVEHLHYPDSHAFGINALFCSLSELSGVFGGLIADRYIGLRRTTLLGAWLLSGGYILLFCEQFFFLSIGFIIAGASLFSGNIMAMVGLLFSGNETKCKTGFTFFYMMQNLGALVSTLICGFIATRFGFRAGFLVASFGMIFGNFLLFRHRDLLLSVENMKASKKQISMSALSSVFILFVSLICLHFAKITQLFLPLITIVLLIFFSTKLLKEFYRLFPALVALILFFAVEDQICSSLLLFAERETTHALFGLQIPTSFIASLNPVVILLFGALVAKKCFKMIMPFILTATSFGLLAILCLLRLGCPIFGVMAIVAIISIAELMIGPLVFSNTSESATNGRHGMVVGMIPLAFSLAFQLSGMISKLVAIKENSLSLTIYGRGFCVISLLMLASGVLVQFFSKKGKISLSESSR